MYGATLILIFKRKAKWDSAVLLLPVFVLKPLPVAVKYCYRYGVWVVAGGVDDQIKV